MIWGSDLLNARPRREQTDGYCSFLCISFRWYCIKYILLLCKKVHRKLVPFLCIYVSANIELIIRPFQNLIDSLMNNNQSLFRCDGFHKSRDRSSFVYKFTFWIPNKMICLYNRHLTRWWYWRLLQLILHEYNIAPRSAKGLISIVRLRNQFLFTENEMSSELSWGKRTAGSLCFVYTVPMIFYKMHRFVCTKKVHSRVIQFPWISTFESSNWLFDHFNK